MIKKVLFLLIIVNFIWAKECSPYFNPEKFYDAPEFLVELFENNLNTQKIFVDEKAYAQAQFIKKENTALKENSYIQHGDYRYPIQTGVWKYKTKGTLIDELNIAQAEIYRFKDEDIANTINDDFGNFWLDFVEDGFSMQLTPEQTLFRYNGEYFTFSVFIYGVQGDATPLKGTVVNFWLKNYTNEVNEYIQCSKE